MVSCRFSANFSSHVASSYLSCMEALPNFLNSQITHNSVYASNQVLWHLITLGCRIYPLYMKQFNWWGEHCCGMTEVTKANQPTLLFRLEWKLKPAVFR